MIKTSTHVANKTRIEFWNDGSYRLSLDGRIVSEHVPLKAESIRSFAIEHEGDETTIIVNEKIIAKLYPKQKEYVH